MGPADQTPTRDWEFIGNCRSRAGARLRRLWSVPAKFILTENHAQWLVLTPGVAVRQLSSSGLMGLSHPLRREWLSILDFQRRLDRYREVQSLNQGREFSLADSERSVAAASCLVIACRWLRVR